MPTTRRACAGGPTRRWESVPPGRGACASDSRVSSRVWNFPARFCRLAAGRPCPQERIAAARGPMLPHTWTSRLEFLLGVEPTIPEIRGPVPKCLAAGRTMCEAVCMKRERPRCCCFGMLHL